MNDKNGFEEGEMCSRNGCDGIIDAHEVDTCSCHIRPPCGACTAPRLFCPVCDWHEADEPIPLVPSQSKTVYHYKTFAERLRDLDSEKIDFVSKSHTHFSMVKEGVYPKNVTRKDVEAVVVGTFGGRFEYFGSGKFKYIAYTD